MPDYKEAGKQKFQFLLGRLETLAEVSGILKGMGVSIPLR